MTTWACCFGADRAVAKGCCDGRDDAGVMLEADGCNCLGIDGLPAGRTDRGRDRGARRSQMREEGRICHCLAVDLLPGHCCRWADGEDGGLLTVAHRRRRVTKGCCPELFEVFASEIGCSLAGSEMLALSPSFWTALISHGRRRRWGQWDQIQRVVLVILCGLDRASAHLAGARRRQPWLPALVRVMEHHTGSPM
ncbi:hypothetical protein ACLOJK_006752, partial [Asimina triloba]